ncbi:MAG: KAP family NTPase [Nitrospirota bacterium]|nr:KAP family NTPase [Nitrospirota bacterium]
MDKTLPATDASASPETAGQAAQATRPGFVKKQQAGAAPASGAMQKTHGDPLGQQPFAAAIAATLCKPFGTGPLTIGLFGAPGSGKSSMIGRIAALLNADPAGKSFYQARFDAARYDESGTLHAGLAQEMAASVAASPGWKGLPALRLDIIRRDQGFRKPLILLGLFLLFLLSPKAWLPLLVLQKKIATSVAKGVVMGAWGVGNVVWGTLMYRYAYRIWNHPLSAGKKTFLRPEKYGTHLSQPAVVARDVDHLCAAALSAKRRMVVFVTGIERCTPQNARRALEAVRQLAVRPHVSVVLAADTESLAHHIGREELGRLVQVPVQMPTPDAGQVDAYVHEGLFGTPSGDTEVHAVPVLGRPHAVPVELAPNDAGHEADDFATAATSMGLNNPRRLERVKNGYRMLKRIYPDAALAEKADTRRTVLLTLFWQELLLGLPRQQSDALEATLWAKNGAAQGDGPVGDSGVVQAKIAASVAAEHLVGAFGRNGQADYHQFAAAVRSVLLPAGRD